MKYLLTGDLEITRKRIPDLAEVFYGINGIVGIVRRELIEGIVFGGDIFREYNADTVGFMRGLVLDLLKETREIIFLVGNHDRDIGIDKLTATFKGWDSRIHIVDRPQIWNNFALLPAPDRAAFGSTRAQEGPRERDAALSEALDAALKLLFDEARESETNSPGETVLIYHATLDAALFGGKKIASGLTWSVPATEVARWGMGIGFHIHSPEDYPAERFGTEIHTIGSPVPDTFGVKGEDFRVGIIEVGPGQVPKFESRSVPRVLQRVEIDIRREGDEIRVGGSFFIPDLRDPSGIIALYLTESDQAVESGDRVALKINARLPEADLALLPDPIEIRGSSEFASSEITLTEVIIRKIPTGLVKTRLDEATKRGGLSPEDLLRKWAEVSGYEGSKTLETAAFLLQGDEFEDWNSAGLTGFNPIKTTVHNFRQYRDAVIDWTALSGRVAITGDNASGKSNIAKATIFGLYKRTPSSPGLDDELRRGETKGSVEVEFEAGGKRYLVRRVLERNSKGRVSCKSELFELPLSETGNEIRNPVCETAREIDGKIAELVGGYDFVVSTFFASEAQIDALTRATPAEMRKHVIEALSLDTFEKFRERAGKESRDLDGRAQKLEAARSEIETLSEKKREALSNFPNAEDLTSKREALEAEVLGLDAIKEGLSENDMIDKSRLVGIEAEIRDAEEKKRERGKVEADYIAAEEAVKALPEASDPPPEVSDLSIPNLASDRALLSKKREERDSVQRHIDQIALSITFCQRDIDAQSKSWDLALEEIKKLEKEQAENSGVPCTETANDEGWDMPSMCPAFAAWGSEKKIEDLRENGKIYKGGINQEVERIKGLSEDKLESEARYKDLAGAVLILSDTLEKNEARNAEYLAAYKARNDWEADKIRRDEAIRELEESAAALKECEIAGEEAESLKTESESLATAISDRKKNIDEISGKIKSGREQMDHISRNLQAISALQEDIASYKERKDVLSRDITALRNNVRGWTLLEAVFHSTGIPFLLLEEALPAIAEETNRLLAPTDLSVSIRSVQENKDGAKKDDIEIRYLDPRGEFPLCVSSGAQEKLLGFCLRFALAKVGGDFWGKPPQIFVQDEGFGAFHPDRYDQVRDIISLIASGAGRFVYITHVTPLAEEADIRFETVVLGDGLSELRRIQ